MAVHPTGPETVDDDRTPVRELELTWFENPDAHRNGRTT